VHFSGETLHPSLNGSESENKEEKKAGKREKEKEREGFYVAVAAGEAF
jgi:hypothetical protein